MSAQLKTARIQQRGSFLPGTCAHSADTSLIPSKLLRIVINNIAFHPVSVNHFRKYLYLFSVVLKLSGQKIVRVYSASHADKPPGVSFFIYSMVKQLQIIL